MKKQIFGKAIAYVLHCWVSKTWTSPCPSHCLPWSSLSLINTSSHGLCCLLWTTWSNGQSWTVCLGEYSYDSRSLHAWSLSQSGKRVYEGVLKTFPKWDWHLQWLLRQNKTMWWWRVYLVPSTNHHQSICGGILPLPVVQIWGSHQCLMYFWLSCNQVHLQSTSTIWSCQRYMRCTWQYIYKGPDHAKVTVHDDLIHGEMEWDEIRMYMTHVMLVP